MGKVIKKSIDKIITNREKFLLTMKGKFKIEFASDSFGPYRYKFERTDCYFNDGLKDRGSVIFPLKNKKFNNTELFIEVDGIVVAIGKRGSLTGKAKTFIDIINIKTEKKYRLFTNEVNLIYNDAEEIVVNAKETETGKFKTFRLDIETLEKKEEIEEELQAFFKVVYNTREDKWYLLDFHVGNPDEKNEEKKYQYGYFTLKKLNISGIPKSFNRKKFIVKTDFGEIDVWEESKK